MPWRWETSAKPEGPVHELGVVAMAYEPGGSGGVVASIATTYAPELVGTMTQGRCLGGQRQDDSQPGPVRQRSQVFKEG